MVHIGLPQPHWLSIQEHMSIVFFTWHGGKQDDSNSRHAADSALDYGYCGNRSVSRKNVHAVGGVSAPNLKDGSKNPVVMKCFEILTHLVHDMDNVRGIGERIPDCFALEILNKNYLHGIRMGITPPLLHFHVDSTTNCKQFPDVYCLSFYDKNCKKRVSVNGQQKILVSNSLKKVNDQADFMTEIIQWYKMMDIGRKVVGPSFLEWQVQNTCGFKVRVLECHMNPTAYSQPTIFGLVRVAHSFGLDLLTITSVHLSSMFVPHCKIFFHFACDIVICHKNWIIDDIMHNTEKGRTEIEKNFPMLQLCFYCKRINEQCRSCTSQIL